ncbi:hypothetical protein BaRGS_00021774 [Batillaria attramentaria]|uniref:Proton-coupled zinc antiporter SLC30A9, mitochondrial n=1 Tax=Batillaria attramentaria TaxID=370345 RepID=A0ABD0KIN7_9CAEN
MLQPACSDLSHILRSVLRARHLLFQGKIPVCAGCRRQMSTFRFPGLSQKKVFLALLAVPSQTCTFTTSAHSQIWRSRLLALSTHPTSSKPAGPKADSGTSDAASEVTSSDLQREGQGGASSGGDGAGKDEDSSKTMKVLTVTPRPRKTKSLEYTYTGNIYILPVRAMNEYLLKPSDLEGLPKYTRRSPYAGGPKITVYLRSDVEAIAKSVWGSLENMAKEKQRILNLDQTRQKKYDVFQIRAMLEEHKKESGVGDERAYMFEEEPKKQEQMAFWKSGSARVVMSAILVNGLNSIMKFIAWLYTGSHSMFSEFIHSVADTMNQVILGVGLYHSIKKPDPDHPYGYSNLRNISSLISGVGIFFLGTGLSLYHGVQGFLHPEPLTSLTWGIVTLVGAFLSEGATLLIAINQVRKGSKAMGITFTEFVRQGVDPNVSVVMLEDMAAVVGVVVAGTCMALSQYMGSTIPDSLGSFIIGGILGTVASFIIITNTDALVGKSIPVNVQRGISIELERDRMIRSLHDVKATHMGGEIRFKAEVDFDGREITRAYLYKQDLDLLLEEMKELQTVDDVEMFMLKHGERIIDSLGEEVDRIEKVLKKKYPDLRHVDLEAL